MRTSPSQGRAGEDASCSAPEEEPAYPGVVDNIWVASLWAIMPTLVVSGLFFFVLRSIVRADRNERREYARIEAEERAKRGLPPAAATPES
jgi:hypothetical protein